MDRLIRSSSQSGLIRLIALFKLLKVVVLIVVGVGTRKLIHSGVASVLEHCEHYDRGS
jgi:hypothetical protein